MQKLKENKKIVIIVAVIMILLITITLILNLNKTKEYEIIFSSDGGTTLKSKKISEGETIERPEDPKKEGYLFVEWTLNGKTFDFSQEITKDMKLEAKWYKIEKDKKYFKVIFDSINGTTIPNQIIEEGKTVTRPKKPLKEGYTFNYWTLNNVEYDFETEITKDITLIAKYVKKGNESSITEKEENIKVEVPTLTNASGSKDKGIIHANLNIVTEGYYTDVNNKSQITGFELYEKNNNEYKLIDTKLITDNPFNVNVIVDAGEIKTYIAKVFVNKNNKKYYSEYSNEIVIDNSKIEKPTLTNASGSKDKGIMYANLNVVTQGVYASDTSQVSGYELYEKNGSKYNWIATKNNFEKISVTVNPGETKTYLARVFVLNKENKKVYSNYSNQITINNKIETPTLTNASGSKDKGIIHSNLNIVTQGYYADLNNKSQITGFELYEKTGTEYKLVNTKLTTDNPFNANVIIDAGQNKTYVARAFVINKENQRVYSDYSNEVKINNKIEAPTLTNASGSKDKGIIYSNLNIVTQGYYADLNNKSQITGFELYEKTGTEYKLVNTKVTTDNPFNATVIIDAGQNKTYVARAFVINKENKKVYSDYSNQITINNKIEAPTLTNASGSKDKGDLYVNLNIVTQGYYADLNNKSQITGFELYEKKGNEIKLIDTKLTTDNPFNVNVILIPGQNKILVARAFALNKSNQKVYSAYSNEVSISN